MFIDILTALWTNAFGLAFLTGAAFLGGLFFHQPLKVCKAGALCTFILFASVTALSATL